MNLCSLIGYYENITWEKMFSQNVFEIFEVLLIFKEPRVKSSNILPIVRFEFGTKPVYPGNMYFRGSSFGHA